MKISNPTAVLGEDLAAQFLKKQKYKILERNAKLGYGEIDIIAIDESNKKDKVLAFVEVKTRTSNRFGTPLESITYWKLESLIKSAQIYKSKHPRLPDSLRIDVVSVMLATDPKKHIIELQKNIS